MSRSVADLPFNKFLGLQPGDDPSQLLSLPAGPQYLNHLGTVHAGALLSLAEAASGEFLLRHFGSGEGLIPVVRRLEAKFRKPAHGALTSSATAPPEALTRLNADLAAKGRALFSIAVEVHDASGTPVLSAAVEWFVQKVPAA